MLKVENLSFLDVISGFSYEFMEGTVTLLVGGNGTGKTVFLKLILGLLNKTDGKIDYDNTLRFGALIEDPEFFLWNSGYSNLQYLASINKNFNKEKINELLRYFSLYDDRNKIVKKYSLGMRKKLGIIQAVMENQDIILFDEPTNGLDKESIEKFHDLVKKLKEEKKVIIIASHLDVDKTEYVDDIINFPINHA